MCGDVTQQPANNANAVGETYGEGSACFKSTLVESTYSSGTRGAACMPFSCSSDKATVTITVKHYQTAAAPSTVICGPNDIGLEKSATGFAGKPDGLNTAGKITCPDPAELCATPLHVTPCPAGATLQADGTCSSSSAATATATASATATATQTPVPRLPVASARPTSAAGTLTVYAALVFTKSGGGGGSSVDVTAFASVNAVDALAASIKAALADSLDAAASAAGAASPTAATKQAIGVTITSITDVATGNFIYQVANPGARRLSGAPGSQGVKVDFVTQVPPTVTGGAALASTLAAAVGPSGSGAAGFQSAVVTRAAASSNSQLAGGFVGVTATATAPSVALPAPKVDGDPLGAAIGGAVGALVVAVFVGIAARFVLRRMLGREGKVAPAEVAAPAARRATGSSV
jgi:hypothetical protein